MDMGETGMAGGAMQRAATQRVVARIAMVLGAALLVAAFFLPWGAADDEWREAAAKTPDVMFYEPTGMTVADATDLSLMEYAQTYGSMSDVTWQFYMYLMYGLLGVAVLALVLAALGKPIGATVFGVLTLALSRLLVWDFGDRGVLPNGTHDWGAAPTVYIVGFVVLLAASVWMFVLKRQAKVEARAKAAV